jgi:hypothetical protein
MASLHSSLAPQDPPEGGPLPLVKSPTMTPGKIAANRANANKSTGPREAGEHRLTRRGHDLARGRRRGQALPPLSRAS